MFRSAAQQPPEFELRVAGSRMKGYQIKTFSDIDSLLVFDLSTGGTATLSPASSETVLRTADGQEILAAAYRIKMSNLIDHAASS